MNIIILVIVGILAALGIYIFISKRKKSTREIEDTAAVVEAIRNIAEYVTCRYVTQLVWIENKHRTLFPDDEICMIVQGEVIAGFDLNELTKDDIQINGKELTIQIPQAKILDVISNPKDCDIYAETGKWSDEEKNEMLKSVKEKIKQDAIDRNVLAEAEKGRAKIQILLQSFGYETVNILTPR